MIKYSPDVFYDPNKPGTIYTLDIETTSLFRDPESGEWTTFDYTKKPAYYAGCEKIGVPYIWMFGVNDVVYYGTDFYDVEQILISIGMKERVKYLWIHNSAWEFQFMRDFLEKYTISRMIARATRKPISYFIDELNINVRCTYALTNLSLAKAAERYTTISKKSGDLNYNVARSPRTVEHMTEAELSYCEYDILCLYEIVSYFKKAYKGLRNIPYTQTGEVRRAYKKRVTFGHIKWIAKRTPEDRIYLMLQKAFQGGWTHANCLYVGRIMERILSFDICSSYPSAFLYKYPMGKFRKIPAERADSFKRDTWAILYHVKFYGIEAAKLNKYILNSKIVSGSGIYADNGRLVSADVIEMYLTEIDYDIITKTAYNIERVEIVEAWAAVKDYLPKTLIEFMLKLYADKTTLKGVIGREDFYMKQKQMLNGL